MKTLRLVLGDQLNLQHAWFREVDDNVTYLMAEMRQETDYVKHHIQKVVGFLHQCTSNICPVVLKPTTSASPSYPKECSDVPVLWEGHRYPMHMSVPLLFAVKS